MRWLLTRGRVPFLAVIGIVTGILAWHAAHLGVERNNESINARDPQQEATYAELKQAFGNDEDMLLSVTPPALLSSSGLQVVAAITAEIAAMPGVRHVYSLTNAQQLTHGDTGAELAPLIAAPLDSADVADRARAALERNPDLTGLLISRDRTTAGILVEIEERPADNAYRGRLIDDLRQMIARHSGAQVDLHLTGVSVQKNDVTQYIERDQNLLIPLAVVVLGLVLAAFFRSVAGTALPLVVTGITVAWTLGLYELSGFELNAITSLLPPLLMVLSLAVSIHVYQAWLGEAAHLGDPVARITFAVGSISTPAFFCTLTTAQGFFSLASSAIPAVFRMGVFAAFGVSVSFLLGMTLIPVCLTYLRKPPAPAAASATHRLMMRGLSAISRIATTRPVTVVGMFTLLSAITALGLPLLHNNTDLVRFLKSSAPLYRDTMFIDQHLTGPFALELMLSRADGGSLADAATIRRMAEFETIALASPDVTTMTSLLAVMRQIHRAEAPEDADALPADDAQLGYELALLESADPPPLVRKLLTADFRRTRLSIRLHAVGTAVSGPLCDRLVAEARRVFGSEYNLMPTGAYYHVVKDSNRLVQEQVGSFGLAIVLVVGAIGLLFRSVSFTIIAMIPNVMPIIWTGGMMGFLGIDLSTGTAMIASAVLGLAVDDTIHYLSHYRRAYRGDCIAAIAHATEHAGAPVTITSVSLVLGFWVGCLGSFKPTIYFSLLTGITMITGAICDLFVLPACLVLFDRLARRTRMQATA